MDDPAAPPTPPARPRPTRALAWLRTPPRGRGTPYAVVLVALLLTAAATHYAAIAIAARDRLRFQHSVQTTAGSIQARLEAHVAMLQAGAGLFAAAERLTAEEFRRYVDRLDLPRRYPGIRGIGFSVRVAAAQRDAVVAAMRRQGVPDFRIWPEHARAEYHAIVYLDPLDERNRAALGYDMFTEGVRRAAMEHARDTGQPAASGKVTLVQEIDERKQAGFLIYVPVYRDGVTPSTEAARAAALVGFVYSPFRADDLLAGIVGSRPNPAVLVQVFDGPEPRPDRLLHRSDRPGAPPGDLPRGRLSERTRIMVAGRPWTIAFAAGPQFDLASGGFLVPLIAVAGVLTSLVLFVLSRSQVAARLEAERIAGELRRSEGAVRVSAEQLREQAQILERARAEAEAASQAKDAFLAMLGHELRNPLAAISNAVAVLERQSDGDGRAGQLQSIIVRQTHHLARLVDDLLDVSRVSSGKIVLDRRPLDLLEVVHRCLASLREARRTGAHEIAVRGEPASVDGDPTRLEQVVGNLLDNALKYTPPGGRIELSVAREAEAAVLRVRDSGAGIAPEMLPRVFELFVQGTQALDRGRGGLGLGLTLTKRLVELHGGTITAFSDGPGHGSEFVVRLPLLAVEASPPAVPADPADGPARRILLVEDHQDAREGLRLLLELDGHQVEVAADGPSGLRALATCRPDIAFVDVGLPGLDGYAVARAARQAPETAHVTLVALTGYGQPEDRERALRAGFDAYLVKPVDEAALRQLLRRTPAHAGDGGG